MVSRFSLYASTDMAVSNSSASDSGSLKHHLQGECVVFVGKLSSMTQSEARELAQKRGADIVDAKSDTSVATLVVIGDGQKDLSTALQSMASPPDCEELLTAISAGRVRVLHESELWERLGLVGDGDQQQDSVKQLYTPAMLAELLKVPVAAVRHWHRQGILLASRSVRRLPYFNFSEVAIARHLADLHLAGCSLRVIDRKLAELKRSLPEVERPLAEPMLIVSGRCLYVRRGDDLTEPGGQLLIDFDREEPEEKAVEVEATPMVLSMNTGPAERVHEESSTQGLSLLEELQETALEFEEMGEYQRAAETYRTMLAANGPAAELHFALADLLYRSGDYSAARERYYAAIEMDEEYVEARASLGCVLAETDELELAVAAFQGALAFHPDYADVHYHMASALERLDRREESQAHWRHFLALAPESPWADLARSHLGIESNEAVELAES